MEVTLNYCINFCANNYCKAVTINYIYIITVQTLNQNRIAAQHFVSPIVICHSLCPFEINFRTLYNTFRHVSWKVLTIRTNRMHCLLPIYFSD